MTKLLTQFIILILSVCISPLGLAAVIITIDFETLPDGTPTNTLIGTPVSNSYASLGLVIRSIEDDDPTGPTFVGQTFQGPIPKVSVYDNNRVFPPPSPGSSFNIVAEFLFPVTSVSADVFTAKTSVILMTAKDEQGNILASITSPDVPDSFFKGNLLIEGVGEISRVEWVSSAPHAAIPLIDNLTYSFSESILVPDHFKCYTTRGDSPEVIVDLEDDFNIESLKVSKPNLFCNPVDKNGEGISNPFLHFTCYKIKKGDKQKREVTIDNQFGEQNIMVKKPKLLCVPSEKVENIQ